MARKAKRRRSFINKSCLCFGNKQYEVCCEPYHKGEAFPETPELLMRSRFSAYAKGLTTYIIETTHPMNEDSSIELDVREREVLRFSQTTSFDGLTIIDAGLRDNDEWGWVHFKAKLNQGGNDASFEEVSHFTHDDNGHWAYVDGDVVVNDD